MAASGVACRHSWRTLRNVLHVLLISLCVASAVLASPAKRRLRGDGKLSAEQTSGRFSPVIESSYDSHRVLQYGIAPYSAPANVHSFPPVPKTAVAGAAAPTAQIAQSLPWQAGQAQGPQAQIVQAQAQAPAAGRTAVPKVPLKGVTAPVATPPPPTTVTVPPPPPIKITQPFVHLALSKTQRTDPYANYGTWNGGWDPASSNYWAVID